MRRLISILLATVIAFTCCSCSVANVSSQLGNIVSDVLKELNLSYVKEISFEEYYVSSPEFDVCYNALNSKQKTLYRRLYDIAEDMPEDFIKLYPEYEGISDDLSIAYEAMLNDNVEIFWMPSNYLVGTVNEGGKKYLAVAFQIDNGEGERSEYLVSKKGRDDMRKTLAKKTAEIMTLLSGATTDYDKELIFNDYICDNTEYTLEGELIYSAYGCLVEGRALCEGYSRAFKLLCNEASIECDLIVGVSNEEAHMWNRVNIDGMHSYVDVTWNDREDYFRHMYFNITEEQLSYDHTLSAIYSSLSKEQIKNDEFFNFTYAPCTYTGNTYYEKNQYSLDAYTGAQRVADVIKKSLAAGNNNAVFMVEDISERERLKIGDMGLMEKIQKLIPNIKLTQYIFDRDVLIIFFE